MLYGFADSEHIKRERRKAQELRKTQWWRNQIGQGVCYHCQQKFTKELLTMDHLVPVARGGKSSKSNCVVSCKDCNNKKGHLLGVEMTLNEMAERGDFSAADQDAANDDSDSDPGSDSENR